MTIFRKKMNQNFKVLNFELKTSKNESHKLAIFQTNQYEK